MVPTMRGGGTGPPGVYGARNQDRSSRAGKVAQEKKRVYHPNIAAQVYVFGPLGFCTGTGAQVVELCQTIPHIL